jgi:hypothetical protein
MSAETHDAAFQPQINSSQTESRANRSSLAKIGFSKAKAVSRIPRRARRRQGIVNTLDEPSVSPINSATESNETISSAREFPSVQGLYGGKGLLLAALRLWEIKNRVGQ